MGAFRSRGTRKALLRHSGGSGSCSGSKYAGFLLLLFLQPSLKAVHMRASVFLIAINAQINFITRYKSGVIDTLGTRSTRHTARSNSN